MAQAPYSPEVLSEALAAFEKAGSAKGAARLLGIPESTVRNRISAARRKGATPTPLAPASEIEFPEFPDEDIPVDEIINHMAKRFQKRQASYDAHTWYKVRVKDDLPIGVLWLGDPHVDDNGCNWPVLRRHAELCRTTDGLYGANIGDSTNNWADRLVKLYANQDTSVKTARRLAAWLMRESGIRWLVYLLGNHDLWGDGAAILAQMAKEQGTQKITCHDWEARFSLVFPNGAEFKIWAAHDFPGNSQWNPLHGPLKASKMGTEADIYVCGHKHNWGVFSYENADRGIVQHVIRVRGFKFLDDYARRLGIVEQQGGCSILTIFDPSTRRVYAFEDVETGARFLTWLRSGGGADEEETDQGSRPETGPGKSPRPRVERRPAH